MSYEEEKQDRKIEQLEAEIERLRADLQSCGAYVGIGAGEGDLPIPERVRRTVNRLNGSVGHYEQKLIVKDARIQELEALRSDILGVIRRPKTTSDKGLILYLKELDEYNIRTTKRVGELEDALVEYQRLGKTIAGKVPCLALHGDCGRCSAKIREVCGALEQIAGGKIGPDVKPQSWQITDERIATIAASLKVLERLKKVNTDTDHCYLDAGIAVLRTMLEASQ